jgi:YgiT-type zinc finger domain-containing protein
MHPGTTTVTFERAGIVVRLHNIPALICDACGEAYFDAATNQKVLDLANAAINAGLAGMTGVSLDIRVEEKQQKAA